MVLKVLMRSSVPLLFLLTASACGPDADPADAGTGSSNSNSSTTTATTTETSTTSATATATSGCEGMPCCDISPGDPCCVECGTSGSGGGCGDYGNSYGPSVPVRITNTTTAPAFLRVVSCDMQVSVGVVDASTQQSVGGLSNCWTCEGAVGGGCICPGPPCSINAALKLDAGASFDTAVGATAFNDRTLDASCADIDQCGATCQQASPLVDGTYEVRVGSGTQVDCEGQACDCTTGAEGWCYIEMNGMPVAPVDFAGAFDMPNPSDVLIEIK